MAVATQPQTPLSPAIATTANNLIAWMSEHGIAQWRAALTKTEGGQAAVATVEAALADLNRHDAVAFVPYGTGALKQAYGGEGETAQEAIVALKENGRLLQFGRGRGYGLVLLDDTALGKPRRKPSASRVQEVQEFATVAKPAPRRRGTAANAPEQLIVELQDATAQMRAEYEGRIRELEEKIAAISERMQAQGNATWA